MDDPTLTVGLPPRCCLTCRDEWDERAKEAGVAPSFIAMRTMILCPECGNKRCPKATHHYHDCTGSNDSGQPGSAYPGRVEMLRNEVAGLKDDREALSTLLRQLRQDYKAKIVAFDSRVRAIDDALSEHGEPLKPLPDLDELRGAFNITDGVDPVEFVRRQRDRTHE